MKDGRDPLLPRLRVVEEKDRRKMTQFLTLGGKQRVNVSHGRCQWIAGRFGLSVKDAGDCREHPSRHVSAKGATRHCSVSLSTRGACA